jgi:hypothetical protein
MAKQYRDREPASNYYYYSSDEREPQRRSHRRRHRQRDEDDYIEPAIPKRERRQRRRTDGDRREAELEVDELRARRADYYSRPESERRRDARPMAQEVRVERAKASPRSTHRESRRDRDDTRRRRRRERVEDGASEDDYVYGRPESRRVVEDVRVKRSSTRRASDEGPSRRTEDSPRKSGSVRRVETPRLSRTASARESTPKVYMATRPSVRRSSPIKLPAAPVPPPTLSRSHSTSVRPAQHRPITPHRKSTGGLLATLFKPPLRSPPGTPHREAPRVECLVCMTDDLPASKTAKLGCGHRMCHACLKRQFQLSVNDPQHMPPTCCTSEHIPLRYVERLFDDKFKILWNKKYQEYTTANRLYCPTKGCGEWIKPSKIRLDLATGKRYARCGRCTTKVCVLCNGRFHTRRECPKDEETNRLVQLAKDKGWQRCYSCKAMVELKEGCNHMTCRCTAQFCMICAAPWKTCNCPWFNYSHLDEGDRLNDMRIPVPRTYDPQDVVEVIEVPHEPPSPTVHRSSTRARRRDRDRSLERAEDTLAAHLQAQLHLNPTPSTSEGRRSSPQVQVYGVGNSGTHHLNESYTVRPLATAAARTAINRASYGLFGRRLSRPSVHTPRAPSRVTASTMAGLSRDGTRRGANRVGTWLQHVELDREAVEGADDARAVEIDDWGFDSRSFIGVD